MITKPFGFCFPDSVLLSSQLTGLELSIFLTLPPKAMTTGVLHESEKGKGNPHITLKNEDVKRLGQVWYNTFLILTLKRQRQADFL